MEKQAARAQLIQLSHARDLTENAVADLVQSLTKQRVLSQIEIAEILGTTQPSVSRMLTRSASREKRPTSSRVVQSVPAVTDESTSSATAQQLIHRAAAGEVDHDDLVDQLRAWDWEPVHRSQNEADDDENGPNSLVTVYLARNLKLISEDELDSILDAAVSDG